MRGNDQAAELPLQPRDVIEAAHILAHSREVDEQDVRPADRPFDARKENEPAFPRVRRVRRRVEVAIVQRHGERAVAERDRAVDERSRRVRDAIGRVVVCMRVKFELDQLDQCIGTPQRDRQSGIPWQALASFLGARSDPG